MKRSRSATGIAFLMSMSLAVLARSAAAQPDGAWSIFPGDSADHVQMRLDARKGDHRNFDFMRAVTVSDLRGLTSAQMASSAGVVVHFEIAREAGTIVCDGYFKQNEGSGTFVFHSDPRFIPAMRTLGITGIDASRQLSMALVDVTSGYTREMKGEGVRVHSAKQLIQLRIFDVSPKYVRDLATVGYTVTEPRELTKFRIFHVTAGSIRGLQRVGYHPAVQSLVKMSIFKVTPDFISEVKRSGYANVPVEELVKMRIFHVTPEYIRRMRSRGLKDLTVDKLVRLRIAGID